MKRFQSRFAALQRLREQQEKMAALAMMQAVANERLHAEEYQQRNAQHAAAVSSVDSLMSDRYESGNVTSARNSIIGAERKALQAKSELHQAQQQLMAASTERTTAFQRLESVRKATQKEVAEYRRQVQAEELVNRIDNIRIHDESPDAADSSRSAQSQKGQS